MLTTSLSTKGQVVIPKDVREQHAWEPGTVFELVDQDGGVFLRPVKSLPETSLDELIGCTDYKGPPVSDEEMDAAIRREARSRR